jgi:hypothetical protein
LIPDEVHQRYRRDRATDGTRIFTDATDCYGLIFLPTIFLSVMTNRTRPGKSDKFDDRKIAGRKMMSKKSVPPILRGAYA